MAPEFALLSPWMEPHSPAGLALELQRELAPGHELYGKPARALAVARDCDDVLFAIEARGDTTYAVVHLTWGRKQEHLPCPHTRLFGSLTEWIDFMKADHDHFTLSGLSL
jgi:hypothetical protein